MRGVMSRVMTSTCRLAVACSMALVGCRGDTSDRPPVHLNQNMDFQARFDAQESSAFFADGRAMRPQVAGTVAMGELNDDPHLYTGRIGRGEVDDAFAPTLPMEITRDLVARGRERFNIYCSPCHDASGRGQGVVAMRGMKEGMVAVPDMHSAALRAMLPGKIFHVISNGARSMPSYAAQIPVRDRWAIVAYIRALQLTQQARLEDVPEEIAQQKGWRQTTPHPRDGDAHNSDDQEGTAP